MLSFVNPAFARALTFADNCRRSSLLCGSVLNLADVYYCINSATEADMARLLKSATCGLMQCSKEYALIQ